MTDRPENPGQAGGSGVEPVTVIREFYKPGSTACNLLIKHGRQVARKSLRIARFVAQRSPNTGFIEAAAMLHDIGMIRTNTPVLGCFGQHPYVCHGLLGREMLESIGLDGHAMVCERHVGAGLTAIEIEQQKLPLPIRDMVPVTLEERIIAYADKFFSKHPDRQDHELPFDQVVTHLARYGRRQVETFLSWAEMFGDR